MQIILYNEIRETVIQMYLNISKEKLSNDDSSESNGHESNSGDDDEKEPKVIVNLSTLEIDKKISLDMEHDDFNQ